MLEVELLEAGQFEDTMWDSAQLIVLDVQFDNLWTGRDGRE